MPPDVVPVSSTVSAIAKEPHFYFSVDNRTFKADELFESIILITEYSDGTITELDIKSAVDFNGATPETEFAKLDETAEYKGAYMGYVSPYYNGEVLADAQSLIFVGVKGDANLDGEVNISDASSILKYYANSAAGLTAQLLTPADGEDSGFYETLAFFLADVTTESTAGANSDAGKLEINDASCVLTYYAQKAAGLAPEWDVIIPSLKEIVGSLWYDRANA